MVNFTYNSEILKISELCIVCAFYWGGISVFLNGHHNLFAFFLLAVKKK